MATLDDLNRLYSLRTVRVLEFLRLLGLRGLESHVRNLPTWIAAQRLRDFCLPARVVATSGREPYVFPADNDDAPAPAPAAAQPSFLEDLLRDAAPGAARRHIVRGGAGDGKTTAVWRSVAAVCADLAQRIEDRRGSIDDPDFAPPLAVPLAAVLSQDGPTGLLDAARSYALRLCYGRETAAPTQVIRWLEDRQSAGAFELLVDGLDALDTLADGGRADRELAPRGRDWLRDQLQRLPPGVRVLLTTRSSTDDGELLHGAVRRRMVCLGPKEVDAYIHAYFHGEHGATDLAAAAFACVGLSDVTCRLAQIPRFLSTLCLVVATERPAAPASILRRALARLPELGLAPWELRYLQARLVTWRAGQVAQGRTHLPDARGEIYRPGLYVPLDGASDRWYRDKPGGLVERGERAGDRAADGTAEDEGPEKDLPPPPLAWWVSQERLPRLALVGAPGAGKTVFLSRLAAALAQACHCESPDMEGLRLEALLRPGGAPRIPILVEATRIAAKFETEGDAALLAALEEQVRPQGKAEPSRDELETGLRAGRYLLLVDAWDEIPDSAGRSRVLQLLRGLAGEDRFPNARMVLTTRSASFTGYVSFGPELEVLALRPMTEEQARALAGNWARLNRRDADYERALQDAIGGLMERIQSAAGEEGLLSNPLMLTAVCMVYHREKGLPEDRGRLLTAIVADLCASPPVISEDPQRGWRLDVKGKRDLLELLALWMQRSGQGVNAWRVTAAEREVAGTLPRDDNDRAEHAKRRLDWTADHTGLLVFQQPRDGPEELRFRHRVFREFLAACRLARGEASVREKVERLAKEGRFIDPFWEDVILFLPRALGDSDRAEALHDELCRLADKSTKKSRGRLLGLAAAIVVESRELFRYDYDFLVARAKEMARIYAKEGDAWPLLDRLLFLDRLGRLVPRGDGSRPWGDPRLWDEAEQWVSVGAGEVQLRDHDGTPLGPSTRVAPFKLAWAPVTVQQYDRFATAPDRLERAWWQGAPEGEAATVADARPEAWRAQLRHPNRPVVGVSWYEAVAYCRWRTAHNVPNGSVIRLPTELEWQWAAEGPERREFPWGSEEPGESDEARANWGALNLGHPTSVGAFPTGRCGGLVDLAGNVWEWCSDMVEGSPNRRVLRGGSFGLVDRRGLRCAPRHGPAAGNRGQGRGLRLAVAAGTR
ncbi:MAG: SUMF1/EgtB/PvdO family nonheme iron enzyme [Planctomycetes bacterium]|nr:SUMF1/EgtB/PvdO family nonheme iron enzyme [Planctomycetota bacterium]